MRDEVREPENQRYTHFTGTENMYPCELHAGYKDL